ncbi:MAG: hypothetical protein OHK0048_14090 [Rhodoferax sp.]
MKRIHTLHVTAALVALLGLAACSNNAPVRPDPTYQEAADNPFVSVNREAINKLIAGFDLGPTGDTPVLVATLVNVNDTRRAAPLGRTLSEQYAAHMVNAGFNVKEIRLRGDVFVKEETGELMLSREVKDIARSHHANYALVGTYSPAANFTYVSLKLVRTEDGRIVRGYNYTLPNDRDVTKLLQVSSARP